MGSEKETEQSSAPRLQLFSNTHPHAYINSPERSGMLTPPLYTSASVPFRWEEQPGKPRGYGPTTTATNALSTTPICLELPPRLLVLDANLSPTVLDVGKSRFQSSSFRIMRRECYGSFRRDCSPERGQLGALVLSKRSEFKDKKPLGSWRWSLKGFRGKREASVSASYVFPDKEVLQVNKQEEDRSDKNVKITRITRSGSFSSHSSSHFWATIYEGLKQVVPWKSRKIKKDRFVI